MGKKKVKRAGQVKKAATKKKRGRPPSKAKAKKAVVKKSTKKKRLPDLVSGRFVIGLADGSQVLANVSVTGGTEWRFTEHHQDAMFYTSREEAKKALQQFNDDLAMGTQGIPEEMKTAEVSPAKKWVANSYNFVEFGVPAAKVVKKGEECRFKHASKAFVQDIKNDLKAAMGEAKKVAKDIAGYKKELTAFQKKFVAYG
jgi:hypothetical protein